MRQKSNNKLYSFEEYVNYYNVIVRLTNLFINYLTELKII